MRAWWRVLLLSCGFLVCSACNREGSVDGTEDGVPFGDEDAAVLTPNDAGEVPDASGSGDSSPDGERDASSTNHEAGIETECGAVPDGPRWFDLVPYDPAFDESSDEFRRLQTPETDFVPVTASLDDGAMVFENGEYVLRVPLAKPDLELPFDEGDSLLVSQGGSAGDDGCCDTETLVVTDEQGNLLLFYAWNELIGGPPWGHAQVESACRYSFGTSVHGRNDWLWVEELSLRGTIGESGAFEIPLPGQSTTTSDGRFRVNWPEGYRGETELSGYPWWSVVLEVVATRANNDAGQ